jgi:hypothetical protein
MSESKVSPALRAAAEAIKDKTLKENALHLLEQMDTVIEGVGDNPITWRPSLLKLVQQTSNMDLLPEGALPGKIVLDGILQEAVVLHPLRTWHSRTMWSEDLNSDQRLCESPDAKVGWRYGNCSTCEFGKWDDTGGREGKGGVACTKNIQSLMISADLKHLFVTSFYKTQYRAGMDFEKLLRNAKVEPYKRRYSLGVVRNANNKNIFNLEAHAIPPSSYTVTADVMAFLEQLFLVAGAERRETLRLFQENMERRVQLGHSPSVTEYTDAQAGSLTVITTDAASVLEQEEDSAVTYSV